jgi:zinc transporter 1/2/3
MFVGLSVTRLIHLTALHQLLGHEILLNPRMMKASNKRMTFAFVCICLGSGLMALLAKWA